MALRARKIRLVGYTDGDVQNGDSILCAHNLIAYTGF